MKVGILTFHNAYNYGAVLQTYATQEIVKSYGHEVEIIDYHNKAIDYHYESRKLHLNNIPIRKFYQLPFYFIEKYFYWKRRKGYHKFTSEYLQLSQKKYHQKDTNSISQYDIIIVGSDQLWNKKITGGWDKMYWGDFKTPSGTRKVAWSICMNNIDLNEDDILFVKKHLENFDLISVRESGLLSFISGLTTKSVYQTLDPTLVLPSANWENVCHDVKEKGYIAVYAVQDEEKAIAYARKIASLQKKSLIIIRSYSKWYFTKENKEFAGPDDFLSYIRYADMVITTSFHGAVFSVIYQKQFVCPLFRDNVRVKSLLDSLHISERIVKTMSDYHSLQPIDYARVNRDLDTLRGRTLNVWNTIL